MKRTMLIATNFDDFASHVIDFCAGTRGRGIVRCIAVNVMDTTGMEERVAIAEKEVMRKKLNILIEPIRQAGIEAEARIVSGDPASAIMDIVASEPIDVIVIGTTTKSRLSRLFTGSLSDELAFGQNVPTLMLRDDLLIASEDNEAISVDWSKKLVVPVDYSAASARAVLQCTKFEPEAVGEVRLLHVLTSCPRNQTMASCVAEQEFRLSAFSRMLEDVGIKAVPIVAEGEVVQEILKEVKSSGATGIVIGSNSNSLLGELFLGSTARAVLSAAPVFTMVVP